jgi:hypothetical protein
MENTKFKIDQMKSDITYVCEYGLLTVPSGIPLDIQHAYNRVLMDLSSTIGLIDDKKFILDDKKLISQLTKSLDIFNTSVTQLNSFLDERVIEFLPDVLILESLFKKDIQAKLTAYVVFSTLTVIQLISFHKYIGHLLILECFEENEENLLALCNAQTQLLVAQDAVNRSQLYLYKAKYPTEFDIQKNELDVYIELEKYKNARSKGGSHSQYYPYKTLIMKSLKQYNINRSMTQEDCRKQIKIDIKENYNVDFNITKSTFSNWLKMYRESKGKSIFKVESNNQL